jgi:hypothetical protein
MAQRFKAKTLISNSGVFNNEVIAPNLVYNTGNQTIAGVKTFSAGIALSTISANLSNNASIDFSDAEEITISGGSQVYITSPFIQTSPAYLGAKVLFGDYNQVTPFEFVNIHGGNLLVDHTGIFLSGIDLKNSKLNNASNVIYNTGNQNISGVKTFLNNFIVSGTGSIFPILQITGVNDISINGNNSFGNYIIRANQEDRKLFKTNYLRSTGFQNIQISGLKTNNVINVFSYDSLITKPNILTKSYQYIMIDGPTTNSRNAINITSGLYSGKALRRFKTGPTIANGYKVIPSLQHGGATVTPKQKYLETVYNITVESGQGAIRPLTFTAPNITTANNPIITLKFNFQADTGLCIVSGVYENSITPIFAITGASYDFIQTERLMYHYNQQNGGTYIRI